MTEAPTASACLAVVETAYRGVLEEQYAHVIWLALVLRGMRMPVDVLLVREAAALSLAAPGRPPTLEVAGEIVGTPDHAGDVARLIQSGARVFATAEDIDGETRAGRRLVPGVTLVDRETAASLVAGAERVWFW